jgi:L-amino acid N-acyltransferase YncA
MFENFEQINFRSKTLSAYNYIVVGQVCVAKGYRGQGVLDNCYAEYKKKFKDKYDFAVTEIATKNQRSINAHKRIGFVEIHRFTGPDNVEWSIVIWEW